MTPLQALAAFLNGEHRPDDVYKMALLADLANYVGLTDSNTFSGVGELAQGDGYETGGRVLTGHSVTIDRVARLDFASSVVWPNATITARGAVIYNVRTGGIIYIADFGGAVTSTNDTFTVALPEPGDETSLIRIG